MVHSDTIEAKVTGRDNLALAFIMTDLVAIRKEQGISQRDMAKKLGTSQSAISALECLQFDVRLSTIQRYARALGYRVNLSLRSSDE